ncbi:aminoglycoside phosphotransferase family protein [Actinomadura viridis]|uniref:Streptomycin 6-kinase n=1 Tax=Actinomadura viridis TaxID=58110 RepID=A0A931DIY1_9ACTN|nr:aminoglycoside phosphotransferase family protein [Actinomadura viridis]MBG6087810.1 streptomycin 6-kinase [Actinomadura viridis]
MAGEREIEVPAGLAEVQSRANGDAGRAWLTALPELVSTALRHWDLRRDGAVRHGMAALVLPVVRPDGAPAVLKVRFVNEESEGEGAALRIWDGNGAVRLIDEDPLTGALLLERLDADRTLSSLEDDAQALKILTEILGRLVAHPAPEGTRRLTDIAHAMLGQVPEAVAALPGRRPILEACAGAVAELAGEAGDRLLHWDLHYDNVLAGTREPWLAIDPNPLAGDPGFDLMPALDNRWDDIVATGDVPRAVRRRFDLMVDMLGLDRRRAAGWTLGRALQNTLWDVEDGEPDMSPVQLAIAEALLPVFRR